MVYFSLQIANGEESGLPQASDMNELRWDEKLADLAQRWADQCKFGHDPKTGRLGITWKLTVTKLFIPLFLCSRITGEHPKVGQNIYFNYKFGEHASSRVPLGKAFFKWVAEKEAFLRQNGEVGRFTGSLKSSGHFTQAIWGRTRTVRF